MKFGLVVLLALGITMQALAQDADTTGNGVGEWSGGRCKKCDQIKAEMMAKRVQDEKRAAQDKDAKTEAQTIR